MNRVLRLLKYYVLKMVGIDFKKPNCFILTNDKGGIAVQDTSIGNIGTFTANIIVLPTEEQAIVLREGYKKIGEELAVRKAFLIYAEEV